MSKKYTVTVFNTITLQYEEIKVTRAVFIVCLKVPASLYASKDKYPSLVKPSTTLMSSFAPNSTGFPAFPLTIGRTQGCERLTILSGTL